MQLPPSVPLLLFSYCLAATAGVPWSQHRAAGGGDTPGLGPGPWGLRLKTAVPTKQLKLRPGEVLAVGRYFRLATGSCFFWESEGRDPGFYFWALPFLPVCFLPYLPRGVGTETTLSITRRLRKQLQWGLPHQPFPSFLGAGSSFYYPLGFDLQLQVAGGAAGALVSDREVSHCAVPRSSARKWGWSGDQQEFWAAQAPVGLCTWGCPPPPSPPHPSTPSWPRRTR